MCSGSSISSRVWGILPVSFPRRRLPTSYETTRKRHIFTPKSGNRAKRIWALGDNRAAHYSAWSEVLGRAPVANSKITALGK